MLNILRGCSEAFTGFIKENAHLIEPFRSDIINERDEIYGATIHCNGTPLDRYVSFMDGTKIQMHRPGGSNLLHGAVHLVLNLFTACFIKP